MIKTDRERLNETLRFIRDLNFGADMAAPHVAAVHAFVAAFVNLHYGPKAHWYNQNPAMHQFSQQFSIGRQPNETAAQRKPLRAVALIKAAMAGIGAGARPAPRTFTGPRDLIDTMWKARLKIAQAAADAAPLNDFLAYFRANAAAVLGTNKILVTGHPGLRGTGAHNVGHPDHNVQDFRFQFNEGSDRYEFRMPGLAEIPGCITIQAVSVTAEHWATVPGRNNDPAPTALNPTSFAGILGTRLAGADIMVTTQFSGCSFCLKRYGNDTLAAHISPAIRGSVLPGMEGLDLAEQLMGLRQHVVAGDFGNPPVGGVPVVGAPIPFHIYGKTRSNVLTAPGGYPAGIYMYLIGVRQGHDWSIYSQHQAGTGLAARIQTPIPPFIRP
ncbi:MAG: hypothetical protein V4505_14070 [Pseudomonadota bacterium]